VIRHAEAKNVYIRFDLDEEKAILEIQDDGKGFIVPDRWITLARKGHLGLVGAKERASAIGGQLELKSSPGEGAKITVLVPYK
jgi:signal transduction histidine kinase